jgi:condensation domain-containing protein
MSFEIGNEPSAIRTPVTCVQESRLRYHAWARSEGKNLRFLDDSLSFRFAGEFDAGAMKRAIHAVCARHDSLTATYYYASSDEPPYQVLRPEHPPRLEFTDLATEVSGSTAERVEAARAVLSASSRQRPPFDAAPQMFGNIIRLGSDDHVVTLFHPSLMMDHWGYDVFVRDLAAYYTAFADGVTPALEPCMPFSAYARLEHESLRNGAWDDTIEFWQEHYRGESPLPTFALPGFGDDTARFLAGDELTGELSDSTVAALRSVWQELAADGITPYAFMLSAVLVLMHGLTKADDIGILVPSANRMDWEYQDTVGLFATISAPRFRAVGDRTFHELCSSVRRTLLSTLDHQQVSYHEMMRRLDPARHGRKSYEPALYFDYWLDVPDATEPVFGATRSEPFSFSEPPAEQEGIAIVFHDDGAESLTFSLAFALRILSRPNAERLARDLEVIAFNAAVKPAASVTELLGMLR